jgi:hypothetical protein
VYGLLRLPQRRCEFSLWRSITIISISKVGMVSPVVRARRGVGMGGCGDMGWESFAYLAQMVLFQDVRKVASRIPSGGGRGKEI